MLNHDPIPLIALKLNVLLNLGTRRRSITLRTFARNVQQTSKRNPRVSNL